jgi:hypothetical protein
LSKNTSTPVVSGLPIGIPVTIDEEFGDDGWVELTNPATGEFRLPTGKYMLSVNSHASTDAGAVGLVVCSELEKNGSVVRYADSGVGAVTGVLSSAMSWFIEATEDDVWCVVQTVAAAGNLAVDFIEIVATLLT